jgi:hypothetical protein
MAQKPAVGQSTAISGDPVGPEPGPAGSPVGRGAGGSARGRGTGGIHVVPSPLLTKPEASTTTQNGPDVQLIAGITGHGPDPDGAG